MFLKDWERRNKRLQQKWSVTSFREAVYPNKHYNPELALKRYVFRCFNGIDASGAKSAQMISSTVQPHDFDETKADALSGQPDEETNFVLRSGRPVQVSVANAQEAGLGGPQGWKGNSLKAGALCDNLIETSAHFRPNESYKLHCRECGIEKTFMTAEALVEQHVTNGLRNCCLIMWQVLAVFFAVLFEAVFIAIHVTLFVNSQSIPVCRSDQKDPFAMGITDPTNPLFFPSCDDVPYNLTKASQDKCRTATLGCFNDMWSNIGTTRWFYLIAIGIGLGILIGGLVCPIFLAIAQCCAKLENHQTENGYQASYVRKSFGFFWVMCYLWPFIVAFVYLPFGKDIFQAIRFGLETTFVVDDETRAFVENSFSWLVPQNYARRMMQLDLMFVCPLIVTQVADFLIDTFAPIYFYRFREWMERHPECCARCCKYNQRSAVDRLIQREQVRRWKAAEGGVSNEVSASGSDSDDEVTGLSKVGGKRDRSKSKLRRRTSGNTSGNARGGKSLSTVRTVDFGESDIFGPGLLRAHTGKRALFMIAARDKFGKPARAHHLRSIFHVSFRMAPALVSGPSLSPFRGPLPARGSMPVQASMAPGLPPSACGGRVENVADLEMTPMRRSGLRLRSNVSALANVSSKRVASINDEILGRPAAERGHHRGHRRSVVGGVPDMDTLADQAAAEEFLGWTSEDERRSHMKFQVSLVEDVDDGLICVSYVPPRAGSMYIAITGGASHRASIKAHLQGSPFRVDVVAPPTYEADDDITDNDGGRRESKNVGGNDDDAEGGKGASRDQDVVKVGWIDLLRGRKTVRRWYKAHGVTENFRIDYYEVDMTADNPMQLRGTLQLSLGFTVTDFDPPKRCKEKGLDFGFAVSRGALGGDHKFLLGTEEEHKGWKQVFQNAIFDSLPITHGNRARNRAAELSQELTKTTEGAALLADVYKDYGGDDGAGAAVVPVLHGFAVEDRNTKGGKRGGGSELSNEDAIRSRRGIVQESLDEQENGTIYINADHIYNESKLDPYKATADYLDMAIQFGYVCMFSVIWPFCPFCALLNNFLEIRGDAFRLMYLRRRPVPRKAANIGHWGSVFQLEIIISIFVSTGIFVLVRWVARRERSG